ncbi:MAG: hypothetical protein WA584_22295 [Pyrinomonadaceae bacterium]
MKLTLKLILVVCLFSSVAFADGDMTNGGFTDGNMTNGGKTDGNMGSGGFTDGNMGNGGRAVNDPNQADSALTFIQNYLFSIFE